MEVVAGTFPGSARFISARTEGERSKAEERQRGHETPTVQFPDHVS